MSTHDTKNLSNQQESNDNTSIDHTAYQVNQANENGHGLTLLELFLQNQDVWERRKMFLDIALGFIQAGKKEITDLA
jgi:hypothetical protein